MDSQYAKKMGKASLEVWRASIQAKKWLWIMGGLVLLYFGAYFGYHYYQASQVSKVVETGENVRRVTPKPSIFKNETVPYVAEVDSLQIPVLEEMRVEDREKIDALVSLPGDSSGVLAIRSEERWFPDTKGSEREMSGEIICPSGLDGCEEREDIYLTTSPQPYIEWDPTFNAGIGGREALGGKGLGMQEPHLTGGVNLVKVWMLRGGASATLSEDAKGRVEADAGPSVGVRIRENILADCTYETGSNDKVCSLKLLF